MWTRRELIWISTTIADQLDSLANDHLPNETGGVLLGYATTDTAVVQKIVGPGPHATHSPTAFSPDHAYHEHRIGEEYRKSNGVTTYLGDWHSHPAGSLRLSARDESTLKRIAHFEAARIPRPIMLIIAGPPWSMGAWRLSGTWMTSVRRLTVRLFNESRGSNCRL